MGVAWQAAPARAVVFPSSDPSYHPSVASKVARHHLHPTPAESRMAEIMEPPTSQPAHPNEHKAVRSSRKNTRPVAQSQNTPGRPSRTLQTVPDTVVGAFRCHYRVGQTQPTLYPYRVAQIQPTLHPPFIDTQADFTQSHYTLGLLTHPHSSSIPPKQQAAFHQQATQSIPVYRALTLYLPYTTTG